MKDLREAGPDETDIGDPTNRPKAAASRARSHEL